MSRPFLDRRRVLALLLGGPSAFVLLRPSCAWADDHDDHDEDDHDDHDNSGPGGEDDDDDDDSSGPGSGDGEDEDRRQRDRDRDRGRGDSDRDGGSDGLRDVTVLYPDGWVERIVAGVYELIDPYNREVVRRPATAADVARMLALR